MSYTLANGVSNGDICIFKIVTGENLIGRLNQAASLIEDVAVLVPAQPKPGEEEEKKFGFYVVPYGFPLVKAIRGETVSLDAVIKVYASDSFGNVQDNYLKFRDGMTHDGPEGNMMPTEEGIVNNGSE